MRSVRRFVLIMVPALALGLAAGVRAAGSDGVNAAKIIQSQGCTGCHADKSKRVGPPWSWIAWRYRSGSRTKAAEEVAKFIIAGGTGYWKKWTGGIPMPAYPNLSKQQVQAVVAWVLSQPRTVPPKP